MADPLAPGARSALVAAHTAADTAHATFYALELDPTADRATQDAAYAAWQATIEPLQALTPPVTVLLATLAAVEAENARLRAGIAELRIDHAIGREEGCVGACTCGADEHNAAIDALLAERP